MRSNVLGGPNLASDVEAMVDSTPGSSMSIREDSRDSLPSSGITSFTFPFPLTSIILTFLD